MTKNSKVKVKRHIQDESVDSENSIEQEKIKNMGTNVETWMEPIENENLPKIDKMNENPTKTKRVRNGKINKEETSDQLVTDKYLTKSKRMVK